MRSHRPLRTIMLLASLALGGCTTGYLKDYLRSKDDVLGPQLARYGLFENQCVRGRLAAELSVWQNRQLVDLAAKLEGGAKAQGLGPHEFLYVAGLVQDAQVGAITRQSFDACGVQTGRAAPIPPASPEPSIAGTSVEPAAPTPQPALWVNLGSARTGQGIAVDAASVTRGESWRQAWFRLLNASQGGSDDVGYLLRVDCAARAITAHAGRRYDAAGTQIEERDYASPEGPLAIEPGTVMEVAFQSLCYDPR